MMKQNMVSARTGVGVWVMNFAKSLRLLNVWNIQYAISMWTVWILPEQTKVSSRTQQ